MSPLAFFIGTLLVTLLAGVAQFTAGFFERRRLVDLASRCGMTYCPHDRFRLVDRVLTSPPAPGAADVSVRDVLYKTDGKEHVFLATVDYTTGAIRAKKNRHRISLVRDSGGSVRIIHGRQDAPRMSEYNRLLIEDRSAGILPAP